jgi:AcrR family transcriptional regulator
VKREPDLETRERLIQAASVLFAEHGFKKVTVREICRASRANVAAVNYHFRDKAGLYREVVQMAINEMRQTNELSQHAGEGSTPEDQIRAFVRIFVQRLKGGGPHSWIHKLMAHEMQEPSEAMDLVVKQVVLPRFDYLSGVASQIMNLPATDTRVLRAVASLQGQCLMFAKDVPAAMQKTFAPLAGDLDSMVEHVAEFSIGGMRAVAQQEGLRLGA